MKYFFPRLSVIAMIAVTFSSGCNIDDLPNLDGDNLYFPNYEGNIALIVGIDTLTVGEFIREVSDDSTAIQENEQSELFIVYEDSSEFNADGDFIDVNSFSNEKLVASPISFPFTPPADTTIIINQVLNFNYTSNDGERIDSLFYTEGTLELLITSDFPGDVAFNITTNSFVDVSNGAGIDFTGALDYVGLTPVSDSYNEDLSGFKTTLTYENDSSVFKVNLQAAISIQAGTNLTGNESIFIETNVNDPVLSEVYGAFGRDTFDIESQTLDLDFFSDFSESGLSFESPSVLFTFENSFGLPAGLDFSGIYASYTDKPDLPLTGPFTESLQMIQAPSFTEVGQSVETILTMDNSNTNINDILSSSPSQLSLSLTGISNPNDENENFVLSESKIKVKSTVEIPLTVKLDAFEYDSDFELGDLTQLDQTESITLILKTINELPFNGELDLRFIDENETPIDSILNTMILESPVTFDNNGKTLEAASFETRVVLDADKIESLTNSDKLRITVRLNSFGLSQDEFVKIFSDYSLITAVAIEGQVSINLNE